MTEQTTNHNSFSGRDKQADSKLREVRRSAAEGFEVAQKTGDLDAAERWYEALKVEAAAFKDLRASIPEGELRVLQAEQILSSLRKEQLGFFERLYKPEVWNLTIPASVSDVEAMQALNTYFLKNFGSVFNRGIIYPPDYDWYVQVGGAGERDASLPREIRISPVIRATEGQPIQRQEAILAQKGMRPALPIEQVLVIAAYACNNAGSDLLRGQVVGCSVSGWRMSTNPINAIRLMPPQAMLFDLLPLSGVPLDR
jgi:hypothetical protein